MGLRVSVEQLFKTDASVNLRGVELLVTEYGLDRANVRRCRALAWPSCDGRCDMPLVYRYQPPLCNAVRTRSANQGQRCAVNSQEQCRFLGING